MIIELGHFSLIIAFILSCLIVPSSKLLLIRIAINITWAILFFIVLAFLALFYSYAISDFSVINVWQNSHTAMPFLFKLTGVWGNHEGSMMLWVFILALFTAMLTLAKLPEILLRNIIFIQGLLLLAFLAFILFTSNPFLRQFPANEGQDLNPILQDIGLALHPPMLYLGYVGFSLTFSFACAGLLSDNLHKKQQAKDWARYVRIWALLAWIFLTGGIVLGSYWAYYELGWGGWWFWDPVENASFLPWLVGTAFLHSVLVMEKTAGLKIWTLLLAIVTFSLSLLGTFLVRSGILTSVHSFASDPARGIFILLILCLFIGGSLLLFSNRLHKLILATSENLFAPLSREGSLIFNNLILCTAAISILFGTLYPLIYEAISGGEKISVGAPFFNIIFAPLMIPLLIVIVLAPLLSWKKTDLQKVYKKLYFLFFLTIFISLIIYAWQNGGISLAWLGIILAIWVMLGSFSEIIFRASFFKLPFSVAFARLRGSLKSMAAMSSAHFGLGVCLLGIVASTSGEVEKVFSLTKGEIVQFKEFTLSHKELKRVTKNTFAAEILHLSLARKNRQDIFIMPSKRVYLTRQIETTEAAIYTFWFSQLYITLGNTIGETSTIIVRWKPFIILIWLGPIFMMFGGLCSLFFRLQKK